MFTCKRARNRLLRTLAAGAALALCSLGIGFAARVIPDKSESISCTTGMACVAGEATPGAIDGVYGSSTGNGTHGVYGSSPLGNGVAGATTSTSGGSGVSGVSTGTHGSGNGVYGSGASGPGVEGISQRANGIVGVTTADGFAGIYAHEKDNGFGIAADSYDKSGTFFPISVQGDNAQTMLFEAYNMGTGGDCFITAFADLQCSGGVSGSDLRVRHRNDRGTRIASYASESASATIEDDGTAQLSGGLTTVELNPDFAGLLDHRWYYVFLTPLGDSHGLYVSLKTPSAFQVRVSGGARESVAFDYRVVGHPRDASNGRLSPAPPQRVPPAIPAQRGTKP
jgi:hypothetical protein